MTVSPVVKRTGRVVATLFFAGCVLLTAGMATGRVGGFQFGTLPRFSVGAGGICFVTAGLVTIVRREQVAEWDRSLKPAWFRFSPGFHQGFVSVWGVGTAMIGLVLFAFATAPPATFQSP